MRSASAFDFKLPKIAHESPTLAQTRVLPLMKIVTTVEPEKLISNDLFPRSTDVFKNPSLITAYFHFLSFEIRYDFAEISQSSVKKWFYPSYFENSCSFYFKAIKSSNSILEGRFFLTWSDAKWPLIPCPSQTPKSQ